MSIKTAQKKVLNDRQASEEVFNTLAFTHPCANDTAFFTKTDTIITSDTLISYKTDTVDHVISLTEMGKTIIKTVKVHDIKTAYIVDTRLVGILKDSVQYYKTSLLISTNTIDKYKHQFWMLIMSLIIMIILRYVYFRALKYF